MSYQPGDFRWSLCLQPTKSTVQWSESYLYQQTFNSPNMPLTDTSHYPYMVSCDVMSASQCHPSLVSFSINCPLWEVVRLLGQTSAILKNCSPPSLPLFLEGACGPLCSPLVRWQLFRYPLGHSCHLNSNFVICHLVGHHSIWITSGRGDRQESPDWPLQLFTTDRLVQFRFSLRASWGWTLDPLVYQTW